MKTKTFQEMTNHADYDNGLEVIIEIPNLYSFKGKIIGISCRGFIPNYIVECTDGFLPNETYSYKAITIPLSYIFPIIQTDVVEL